MLREQRKDYGSGAMKLRKLLDELYENISYECTTSEIVEIKEGLDKELDRWYNSLRRLQKPQSQNEADHTLANLLEDCCCEQWRARVRGGSDYCPDCIDHKSMVGTREGELRIVVGPKSVK